jgi:hypothetical protein
VKLIPLAASLSMFGVFISDPKHPISEKPISSVRMTITLGFFEIALFDCENVIPATKHISTRKNILSHRILLIF